MTTLKYIVQTVDTNIHIVHWFFDTLVAVNVSNNYTLITLKLSLSVPNKRSNI